MSRETRDRGDAGTPAPAGTAPAAETQPDAEAQPGTPAQPDGETPPAAGTPGAQLDVTVVVCAYTERRWPQTRAALDSALGQHPVPRQVLLVVDHNPALAQRAAQELAGIAVEVLESTGAPGLSGARNTGLAAASQPVTVFLDDDAQARPGWLEALVGPYSATGVVATGGSVYPRWPQDGPRPSWLPPEFDWVVGCSYRGLPEEVSEIRNPIGANMSMRTGLALEVGGFNDTVGRVGTNPRGCEETELSIRLTARQPGSAVCYVPGAAVDHHVAQERVRFGYFLRRCWHEGMSKADVVRLAGASAGLERERRQTAVVIPAALLREFRGFATGNRAAGLRMGAAVAGLSAAASGYFNGRARLALHRSRSNPR
jgi:glucosyl-dolichyl phosphate glucuronosyltransferase